MDTSDTPAIIDFETLDIIPTSKILSLAITFFDPTKISTVEELKENTAYWNIDISRQTKRTNHESVIRWWSEQHKDIWKMHRQKPLLPPEQMLIKLQEFITKNKITHLVGNSSTFDNSILNNLCNQYDIKYPIPFWGDLDLRTLAWLADIEKPEFPKELTKHIAQNDTIAEAIAFQTYYKSLKQNGN